MSWLARPASDIQVTHGGRLWLYVVAGLIMAFLVIPTLIVIPMSFSDSQYLEFPPRVWSVRWYDNYFGSTEWMTATWVSVKAAFLTVLVTTPVATMAAYGLYVSNFRAARFIFVLLITPMMVPVILIAIGVFFAYAKLKLNNTMFGLVLAHTVLALPMCLIVVSAGLRSYDMNQERVARSLGASRLKAFLMITLPQIRFSVVSGALLAFVVSFDEVIVALFISGGNMSTITRSMFLALRDQIDPDHRVNLDDIDPDHHRGAGADAGVREVGFAGEAGPPAFTGRRSAVVLLLMFGMPGGPGTHSLCRFTVEGVAQLLRRVGRLRRASSARTRASSSATRFLGGAPCGRFFPPCSVLFPVAEQCLARRRVVEAHLLALRPQLQTPAPRS